jgi:hypothetical protein
MKQLVGIVLSLLAVGLVVGCGDDDGGDSKSSTFNSSIPDSKQLGSLSDAESQQFCKDLEAYGAKYAAETKDTTCQFSAVTSAAFTFALNSAATDAELQQACKSTYDACLKAPSQTKSTCSKPSAQCTATVAEFETCMSDAANGFDEMIASLPTCASINRDSFKTNTGTPTTQKSTPACDAMQQKCAELSPTADDEDSIDD